MPIGTFEAIKRSPFFNGNSIPRPFPKNTSAEIKANAQHNLNYTFLCEWHGFIKHPLRMRQPNFAFGLNRSYTCVTQPNHLQH